MYSLIASDPEPRTSALPLLAQDGDFEQWKALRLKGIGASEMAVVLGRSPYSSPYALYHAKLGGWDLPDTQDMEIGRRLESTVAEMFADEHTELIVDVSSHSLWAHPQWTWMMCTPDRIAVDADGVFYPVEIKTDESTQDWGYPGTDEIPQHYRIQLMVQMGVLGARIGFLARMGRKVKGHKYGTYVLEFDATEFRDYVEAGEMFMWYLSTKNEPPMDSHRATLKTLERVFADVHSGEYAEIPEPLATTWREAREELAAAKRAVAHWDNELRRALGHAELGMNANTGDVFVKRSIGKRDGYTVQPTTVDSLRRIGSGSRTKGGRLQEADEAEHVDSTSAAPLGEEASA